ncbi:DUF423 domain-containing protein [Marilutibacter chinensis]|uniref:DUF423 domain-containing protein n=1 Tax=Marilutibacter chinensis TaxID=2912247 RepID=A0ABS9HR30_9GAMM|nr:DUF423 domain-containing protein [Lysobacter chinensis]MCF7221108.1 DUF423 domain-containing protein [Lysobacter chinensis]
MLEASAALLLPTSPLQRGLASAGALLAALSIALAAYAAHAAGVDARAQLQLAAAFVFGHGLALCALAPRTMRRLGRAALAGLLVGVLLFSGSLVAAHVLGWPTRLAPAGASLMILAWLGYAVDAARH